jgi:hypothetical protein
MRPQKQGFVFGMNCWKTLNNRACATSFTWIVILGSPNFHAFLMSNYYFVSPHDMQERNFCIIFLEDSGAINLHSLNDKTSINQLLTFSEDAHSML